MSLVVSWEETERVLECPRPWAVLFYCFRMFHKGKIIAGVYYPFHLCPAGIEICLALRIHAKGWAVGERQCGSGLSLPTVTCLEMSFLSPYMRQV